MRVEQEERTAFEAWALRQKPIFDIEIVYVGAPSGDAEGRMYVACETQSAWVVWQARGKGEMINLLSEEPVPVMLLSILAAAVQETDWIDRFGAYGGSVRAELFVNGHKVPVAATLQAVYERLEEDFERRTRLKAIEMVTQKGLGPVAAVLSEYENKVRTALDIWDTDDD
jgi:hypothetical protein